MTIMKTMPSTFGWNIVWKNAPGPTPATDPGTASAAASASGKGWLKKTLPNDARKMMALTTMSQ